MKRVLMLGMVGVLSCSAILADKEPDTAHLPAPVRQAINEWKGQGDLKKVKTRRGPQGTVYEVEYKERGDEKEITIAEDGTIISESEGKKKGKGKGNDKKKDKKGKEKDDDNEDVRNDGGVNSPSDRPASTKSPQPPIIGQPPVVSQPPMQRGRGPVPNSTNLQLRQAPQAVQDAVNKNRDGAKVEYFSRGESNGQPVYQVGFRKDGQSMLTQILQNGTIIGQGPGRWTSTSAEPPVQRGRGPVPNSTNLQLRQAPQAVQDAVNKNRDGAKVEYFSRGESNGQPVYQVGFRKDGQSMLTQILENGTIIGQGPGHWTSTSTSANAERR